MKKFQGNRVATPNMYKAPYTFPPESTGGEDDFFAISTGVTISAGAN